MNLQLRRLPFVLLFLSACVSPRQAIVSSTQTSTQPIVSITSTSLPTKQIQTPKTPQPESTHTTSTITATFNVASIITRTPAPAEDCPAQAKVSLPDLSMDIANYSPNFAPREEEALHYLNAGGNPSNLIVVIRQYWKRYEAFGKNEVVKDLTGDGIPEIIIIPSELYVFGCQHGTYQILFKHLNEAVTMNGIEQQLVGIEDLNLNGTPELVFASFGCGGMGAAQCLDVYIYEWDGKQFKSLIPKRSGYEIGLSMIGGTSTYLPGVEIKDIDNNRIKEVILVGGIPSSWYSEYFVNYPWRDQSDIYTWNGSYYVLYKTEFSTPVYRYQAVQDGDRASLHYDFENALAFYQSAIFNVELLGWSLAHSEHFDMMDHYTWDPDYYLTPTPTLPPNDPQEYPNLAAYARYRIMLLHILQGHMPEAKTVYSTLQEKFPDGSSGYEFARMAQAFWDEYQIYSNIELACQKAIAFAQVHQEILTYLGGEHHNPTQDIWYGPKDVCPFK